MVRHSGAVVHEGPEAYVFQQNGDLFNRISVQVLHRDRSHVVIANDGKFTPGFYLAQGSAASLNRVLKAQAACGMRADVHVHADGTMHALALIFDFGLMIDASEITAIMSASQKSAQKTLTGNSQ